MRIGGIVRTETGYAAKDFLHPQKPYIPVRISNGITYREAVARLTGRYCPESFRPYLLAMENRVPGPDTWDNLVFAGHADGCYDHRKEQFRSVRSLGMHAASDVEQAYVEALQATGKSIRDMVH